MPKEKAPRPRRWLAWFARQMESRLRDNDHKGGWLHCELNWLLGRAAVETQEACFHLKAGAKRTHKAFLRDGEEDLFIRECADGANFLMMAADIARRIKKEREKRRLLTVGNDR